MALGPVQVRERGVWLRAVAAVVAEVGPAEMKSGGYGVRGVREAARTRWGLVWAARWIGTRLCLTELGLFGMWPDVPRSWCLSQNKSVLEFVS